MLPLPTTRTAGPGATSAFSLPNSPLSWFAPLREFLAEAFSGGVYTALRILDHLHVPEHGRVLDVGTGAAVLPLLLLAARPDVTVLALDILTARLVTARRTAQRSGAPAHFAGGRAEQLPFADQQFDVVVSALLLHHLPPSAQAAACREFARVLKPGGLCYLADFARPRTAWARWAAVIPRITCSPHVHHHFHGVVPHHLAAGGFAQIVEVYQTVASVSLYRAVRNTA